MSTTVIPHDLEPHPLTGMYNGKFGIWLFLASEVMLFGALFSTYVLLRVGAPPGQWPAHGSEILNVPLATLNTAVLIGSSVTMVMSWAALKMKKLGAARVWLTVTFLCAGAFLVVKYFEYTDKFSHYQVWLNEPIKVGEHEVTTIKGHLTADCPKLEVSEKNGAYSVTEHVMITPDAEPGGHAHGEAVKIEASKVKRISNFGPRHSPYLATYFTMTGLHGLHIVGGMVVILYFILTGGSIWKRSQEKYTNRIECTGLYWHFVDLVWIFLFPVLYLL
ncbi:MAG: cytochrome c oxidase subunit 3 [Planctomycetota bacterium]